MTDFSLEDLSASLTSQIPVKKSRKSLSQKPESQILEPVSQTTIHMSTKQYEKISGEFRCPICRNILQDPVWLPCMHVFCRRCVKTQVVNEKTSEKMAKCAECKCTFSHRSMRQNKKFENILEVFKSFRDEQALCTQMPAHFPVFDPIAAKEKLLK